MCGELDERAGAFLSRPVGGDWPYPWVDATCADAREASSIVSLAVAVNTDGQRQVIGMKVGPNAAETFWTGFLRSLVWCGLHWVRLVTGRLLGGNDLAGVGSWLIWEAHGRG